MNTAAFQGSTFRPIAGERVVLGCISPEARDLLDTAMDAWRENLAERERKGIPAPTDHAYAFAYWLIRWSGLVQPAAPIPSCLCGAPLNPAGTCTDSGCPAARGCGA